jgi:IS5 family transposase
MMSLSVQVNDRRSFEEFVGVGVMNAISDATTVGFYRERLRKVGVIEELFEQFEEYLREQGGCKSVVARSLTQCSFLFP